MLNEIKAGCELPSIKRRITQERINNFAQLSGGTDAIHVNSEYAARTVFKSTLAHGLMLAGYISEVIFKSFGEPWLCNGTMSIKFTAPVKVDELITTEGIIESVEIMGSQKKVICYITCSNEKGPVIIAATTVTLND